MDMKVKGWVVALVSYWMYLTVMCFNLGVSEGVYLNTTIIMSLIWFVLFFVAVTLLVFSIFTAMLTFGDDEKMLTSIVSVSALILGCCLGDISSCFTRGSPDFAGVLSINSLSSVLWKPYLSAYIMSFILLVMTEIWEWYEEI